MSDRTPIEERAGEVGVAGWTADFFCGLEHVGWRRCFCDGRRCTAAPTIYIGEAHGVVAEWAYDALNALCTAHGVGALTWGGRLWARFGEIIEQGPEAVKAELAARVLERMNG